MGCGLPVAATEVGAIGEVVTDGDSGLLVPAQQPAMLGAALTRLLGDPGLRSRLGTSARKRVVREFAVDRVVSNRLRAYETALAHREARRGRI
jgi:glycosyltransferase involved in cell wall biosynthesis